MQDAIAQRVEAMIVTLGAEGSRIHTGGGVLTIPAVVPSALVDPTGCGDAYRAGLLYGIAHGWGWQRTGRLASLLGSLKIASRGGQNHVIDRERLAAVYADHFGESLW
jgi:adenosine kinase